MSNVFPDIIAGTTTGSLAASAINSLGRSDENSIKSISGSSLLDNVGFFKENSLVYSLENNLFYKYSSGSWIEQTNLSLQKEKLITIFSVEGSLSIGSGKLRIYNLSGKSRTIESVWAFSNTAPSGSSIVIDINMGGSTIFTNQTYRPIILAGANSGSTGNFNYNTWYSGSYITMDVDTIGTSVPGSDLTVHVVCG